MKKIVEQLKEDLTSFNTQKNSISSIFIGGGTPSSVDATFYEEFFKLAKVYLKENVEITAEANPNSATETWLKTMKDFGVNRISFGVQSFNEKKIIFLGRAHSKEIAISSIQNADKIGFKNISLDLIYGTKLDNKKLLLHDVQTASDLPINHISSYSLTIEEKTPFFKTPDVQKDSTLLSKYLYKTLNEHGFRPYEISNFSRGYECTHNIGYWSYEKYIGIGSGAVGFDGVNRIYTTKNPKEYIKYPNKKRYEIISKDDEIIERIFLGFRSKVGVEKHMLPDKMGEKIDILLKNKKLVLKNGKLYNPNYFLADEITLFITS